MPALSFVHLDAVNAVSGAAAPVGPASPVRRAAFEEALARSGATPAVEPPPAVSAPAETTAPAPVQAAAEADAAARERVRRTLDLDGTTAPRGGDSILDGLQRLRGVFDGRHTRINEMMNSQSADFNTLMSMQLELAQYTLLIDVSSKLTGKSTQSMDTLMKG